MEQKGFDVAVAALASLPDTELVVIGGPPVAQLSTDEVAIRLVKLAERLASQIASNCWDGFRTANYRN